MESSGAESSEEESSAAEESTWEAMLQVCLDVR